VCLLLLTSRAFLRRSGYETLCPNDSSGYHICPSLGLPYVRGAKNRRTPSEKLTYDTDGLTWEL